MAETEQRPREWPKHREPALILTEEDVRKERARKEREEAAIRANLLR